MSKELKLLKDYVILKVQKKEVAVDNPMWNKGMPVKDKKVKSSEIEKVTIYAVGADVEGLKEGDEVLMAWPSLNDPSNLIFPNGYGEEGKEKLVHYLVSLGKNIIGKY